MTRVAHKFMPFRRVLAVAAPGFDAEAALATALSLAEPRDITLLGLVTMPPEEPLAFGMLAAQEARRRLRRISQGHDVRTRARVTHDVRSEIAQVARQEQADLLVIGFPFDTHPLPDELLDGLAKPPCDVALASGGLTDPAAPVRRILTPLRGGPYAELAVRTALAIATVSAAEIMALHVRPPGAAGANARTSDPAFRDLAHVLAGLPGVTLREVESDDEVAAILAASRDADLVVMGSAARLSRASLGRVVDRVSRESRCRVMLVRSQRAVPVEAGDPAMGQGAIALLVDQWLAESSYHADEFAKVEEWCALKEQRGLTVSLVAATLNDEAAVGKMLRAIKPALHDRASLLDEIVVIDAGSYDETRQVSADLGAAVYRQQEILPQYGALGGRGEALWKSLYLTRGDLIVWLDGDLSEANPHQVCGLLGPLLSDERAQYVKGFGRAAVEAAGKSPAESLEMAELAVRPFLSLLYPELSGVLRPVSGAAAGRRAALERLPFQTDAGVQLGLLLDIVERYGLPGIAQVELPGRSGEGGLRSPEALIEAAYAVALLFIRRLERRHSIALVEDVNRTMKLIRADADRLHLALREVREPVRPPMIEIPEYLAIRSGGDER